MKKRKSKFRNKKSPIINCTFSFTTFGMKCSLPSSKPLKISLKNVICLWKVKHVKCRYIIWKSYPTSLWINLTYHLKGTVFTLMRVQEISQPVKLFSFEVLTPNFLNGYIVCQVSKTKFNVISSWQEWMWKSRYTCQGATISTLPISALQRCQMQQSSFDQHSIPISGVTCHQNFMINIAQQISIFILKTNCRSGRRY